MISFTNFVNQSILSIDMICMPHVHSSVSIIAMLGTINKSVLQVLKAL